MVQVTGFDHLVLLVRDAEASLGFYAGRLGLAEERVEEWRRGEVPFPSVRVDGGTVIDLLQGEPSGRSHDHVCFVVAPTDLAALRATFDVVEGPVPRWGARGVGTSVYVRDPDGYLVELRTYDRGSTP